MDLTHLAESFKETGEDYETYRPGFPEAAAELALPEHVNSVVDVGAGTGKFTRLLFSRARTVMAVDPSDRMLAELRRQCPGVTAHTGVAEDLPIDTSSQDVVTVAQAFHWFDEAKACAEFRRVLIPRGRLALVWNGPTPNCDWDVACYAIAHPAEEHESSLGKAARDAESNYTDAEEHKTLAGFEHESTTSLLWDEEVTRAHYLGRWKTVSTYVAANSSARTTMISAMEKVLDEHPETSGRSVFTVRHRTDVYSYIAES